MAARWHSFVAALSSCSGLTYGGPIFDAGADCLESREELDNLLGSDTLIVLATRPPLDDPQNKNEVKSSDAGEGKKPIPRTGWAIEEAIFDFMRDRFFDYCSRARLDLKPEWARRLPDDLRNRGSIRFYAHGHADITKFGGRCEGKARAKKENGTAGFLAYAPHITPWLGCNRAGPGLLAVFGMGGVETLVWSSLLASSACKPSLGEIVTRDCETIVYSGFAVPRPACDAKPPATISFAKVVPDIFEVLERP